MNPAPPILDYRTRRPKRARIALRDRPTFQFALILSPIALGWVYVVHAILRYCTGMAPFSGTALIVSLLVLAASIVFALALRVHD